MSRLTFDITPRLQAVPLLLENPRIQRRTQHKRAVMSVWAWHAKPWAASSALVLRSSPWVFERKRETARNLYHTLPAQIVADLFAHVTMFKSSGLYSTVAHVVVTFLRLKIFQTGLIFIVFTYIHYDIIIWDKGPNRQKNQTSLEKLNHSIQMKLLHWSMLYSCTPWKKKTERASVCYR